MSMLVPVKSFPIYATIVTQPPWGTARHPSLWLTHQREWDTVVERIRFRDGDSLMERAAAGLAGRALQPLGPWHQISAGYVVPVASAN